MRYIHSAAGQEYYWLIIPLVGMFVVLFNANRMGKIREIGFGGKVKIMAIVVLSLVAVVCLTKERVLDSYLLPYANLSAYPNLEEAFIEQEDAVAGEQIVVVEVGNLFSSHEVYLLPCYSASTGDVPQNGQTHWYTEIFVLGDDSVTIRDVELNLDFGEETFLSSRVELNGGDWLYDMGTDRKILLSEQIPLTAGERFRIGLTAGTSTQAKVENQQTQGSFLWSYDLYYDGTKVAEIRDDTVSGTYLINAT